MGALPFGREAFLGVIAAYNVAVWPLQIPLLLLGAAALVPAFRDGARWGRIAAGSLAVLWLWMGAVFHAGFFTAINPAAYLFGALFVVQGILFAAMTPRGLPRPVGKGWRGIAAAALAVYALAAYPALAAVLGHRYPYLPTFGLPCPTTILTLALLMGGQRRPPAVVLVIPVLWSIVALSAAVHLGMWEDLGLAVAGVTTLVAVRSMPSTPGLRLPRAA